MTAGDAGQTPVTLRRARTRQLVKERDVYKQERDSAQGQVASLQQDKSQLEDEIATKQNSLYSHADSDQNLKRLRDVKGVSYDQSVDLSQETSIALDPRAYGLEQIRSVRLLPAIYEEGRDFSVEIEEDHSGARLHILDPDVFKGKEVLLALHG